MSEDNDREPTPLDYATPNRRPNAPEDWRGPLWCVASGVAVCVVTTLWWRVGIRIGQRVEKSEQLFFFATGTTFWDVWVIEVPLAFLLGGLSLLSCLTIVQVIRLRWPGGSLGLLILFLGGFFFTLFANMPLLDWVSP